AERWQDIDANLLPVIALGRWPLARDMLIEEARAQLGDGRGGSVRFLVADGISAAVDLALEPLGLLAGSGRAPVRECADGDAPLTAVGLAPVIQNECPRAVGGHAQAEA